MYCTVKVEPRYTYEFSHYVFHLSVDVGYLPLFNLLKRFTNKESFWQYQANLQLISLRPRAK